MARLVDASVAERLAISVAALFASLVVGGVIVLFAGLGTTCDSGFVLGGDVIFLPGNYRFVIPGVEFAVPGVGNMCYNPLDVYYQLFVTPFLTCGTGGLIFGCDVAWFNLGTTLKETTLLVFTGLSVAIAFRAGLFNIGTQGQAVAGALGTALGILWVAPYAPGGLVGAFVLVPLGLLFGALVGGAYGAIPGALKAYSDANEVITTIMLNFIAIEVVFFLVSSYFQDPGSQSVETRSLPPAAQLNPVLSEFANTAFSVVALVVGVLLVAVVYYLIFRTAFGYDLRTSGLQPAAAAYGGVDAKRMIVASMTISGALGGIAGAVYTMMVLGRFRVGIPAIGFDGITVSILASNNPVGVVLAALLFGVLKAGSLSIGFELGVPRQLVGVLRGLVILFVAMPEFFRMIGQRWNVGAPDEPAPGAETAADGGVVVDDPDDVGEPTSTDDSGGGDRR